MAESAVIGLKLELEARLEDIERTEALEQVKRSFEGQRSLNYRSKRTNHRIAASNCRTAPVRS